MVELPSEILDAIFVLDKKERTQLALDFIEADFCDLDSAFEALGLPFNAVSLNEQAHKEAAEEYPLEEQIYDIPSEEISAFLNELNKEMR